MNQSNDQSLREHLIELLSGGHAHVSFDDFVKDFPVEKCSQRLDGLPYTAWQVLEHMRIAQWDILEFSRDAHHISPKWPQGYWPNVAQAGSGELWHETVAQFRQDLQAMQDLLADPATDLFARIPHGTGQTILREALLLADHNSNHLGALIVMSRMLKFTH
ncbi:MAG TPA: DinB family protein [Pyrinomonadaceae bacterium]|nr:DinB family protein [Pyrinomonadaceae bacterium]